MLQNMDYISKFTKTAVRTFLFLDSHGPYAEDMNLNHDCKKNPRL